MRLLVAILAIFFIFGQPSLAMAEESDDGIIDGQLILQTGNGDSLAEVDVILVFFTDEMVKETRTTQTDAQGKFKFTGLSTDREYMVLVYYGGIDYYYPLVFGAGETRIPIEVSVCDTTTSDERIRVILAHVIIYAAEESVSVTEVLLLVNDGDRTYVGAKEATAVEKQGSLIFTLPEGASDFDAPPELMQDYMFLDNNKVADTVPFPPGERQLVYSYKLAKEVSSDFILNLVIDYPTDRIEVMVKGADIEVSSPQLRPEEPVDSDTGERFMHLSGENLLRGDTVEISLSILPGGGRVVSPIVWFIAAVVILGISIYVVRRKKRTGISAGAGSEGDAEAHHVQFYFTDTPNAESILAVWFDSTGTQSIVNETTEPTGAAGNWTTPLVGSKLSLSDLAAAGNHRLWIRRTVDQNADNLNEDTGTLHTWFS